MAMKRSLTSKQGTHKGYLKCLRLWYDRKFYVVVVVGGINSDNMVE
jgi:hypothetical protein